MAEIGIEQAIARFSGRAACARRTLAEAVDAAAAAAAISIDGASLAVVWTCLALVRSRLLVAGVVGRTVGGLITLANVVQAEAAATLRTGSARLIELDARSCPAANVTANI